MSQDSKLHLIIATTAGDVEEDFPLNQPLHAIKHKVMGQLQLDPSQADQFVLTLSGNPVNESTTVGELNPSPNTVLILERKEVVKI